MTVIPDRIRRRAGPLFGVLLVAIATSVAFSPLVPAARAVDPTPGPAPSPTASEEPSPPPPAPVPTPDPTSAPQPDPTPAPAPPTDPVPPTAAPTTTPAPTAPTDPPAAPTPAAPPSAEPTPSETPAATPTLAPSAPTDASAPPVLAPGVHVAHAWVETVNDRGDIVAEGAVDGVERDLERYRVYRVRFQVLNTGDADVDLAAVLEWGTGLDPAAWRPVGVVDPIAGEPFYAATDDGRTFRVARTAILVSSLRLSSSVDPGARAVPGVASRGVNPIEAITLPARSFTEVAFAVRGTHEAAWDAAYAFRLRPAGAEAVSTGAVRTATARVELRSKPSLELTPGQRAGVAVGDEPLPRYPLRTPAAATALVAPAAAQFASPHANYGLTTGACAACHSSHTAQDRMLLVASAPQSTLCFRCHDGTGASTDVASAFSRPGIPANDPATASWYSHPALTASAHTSDRNAEFAGVLDRHSACADCHQPHVADGTVGIPTAAGWTASGAIGGASGVAVRNGQAGSEPTYTRVARVELEYQLCFKCHSGYTQLPDRDPDRPSRWALDKAVELNPANVSYHPVEAAGRNQTTAMSLSLAGTSPYKLWAFETTSVIRCLNCHADGSRLVATPGVDARLPSHASENRGILIAPYRDRDLKGPTELYSAADFALCYTCHAEAPMVDDSGDPRYDTNFNWHGFHLRDLVLTGTGGRDIDIDGAGEGNAICSECHFRTHGTAFAVDGQAPAVGLVNFAPNVQPFDGALSFVAATPGSLGSCTLTCHGKPHDGYVYSAAP